MTIRVYPRRKIAQLTVYSVEPVQSYESSSAFRLQYDEAHPLTLIVELDVVLCDGVV